MKGQVAVVTDVVTGKGVSHPCPHQRIREKSSRNVAIRCRIHPRLWVLAP